MYAARLIEILEHLDPVELKGVELLRELRPQTGVWFPDSRHVRDLDVTKATLELIIYVRASRSAADQLASLQPVPLAIPLMEYSL